MIILKKIRKEGKHLEIGKSTPGLQRWGPNLFVLGWRLYPPPHVATSDRGPGRDAPCAISVSGCSSLLHWLAQLVPGGSWPGEATRFHPVTAQSPGKLPCPDSIPKPLHPERRGNTVRGPSRIFFFHSEVAPDPPGRDRLRSVCDWLGLSRAWPSAAAANASTIDFIFCRF